MTTFRRLLALALVLPFFSGAVLQAQTVAGAPATIDYQGKALDPAGNPLAPTTPANYEMQFRIYDAQEGGALIWSEKQIVTVSKGMFSVRLGEGVANGAEARPALADAFNAKERFLGVTIVITGQATTEISPRLAFLATPFAYVANKSMSAERLVLNSSTTATPSSINLSQVSHTVTTTNTSTTLTDQFHTWGVASTAIASTTVTLPGVTSRREYYVFKTDSNSYPVFVSAPSGGMINGSTAAIKLKVLGEGVVIQNTDGNNWWIIGDTRDRTPVGTVITSAQSGATPPPGYLYCNATAYSRTDVRYSDLFAAIGAAWGYYDASNFRVPDLRGAFLRGVDGGRRLDPGRNERINLYGGNTGDMVGTYQADILVSHVHDGSVSGTTASNGAHTHGISADATGGFYAGRAQSSDRGHTTTINTDSAGAHTHSFSGTFTTGSTGGLETRPKNLAVYYFIKY